VGSLHRLHSLLLQAILDGLDVESDQAKFTITPELADELAAFGAETEDDEPEPDEEMRTATTANQMSGSARIRPMSRRTGAIRGPVGAEGAAAGLGAHHSSAGAPPYAIRANQKPAFGGLFHIDHVARNCRDILKTV
jgi:hypothetical protein